MTVPSISQLTQPGPNRGQAQAIFRAAADVHVSELPAMITEFNLAIAAINAEVTGGNYKGLWSAATGAKNIPENYLHNGSLWSLTQNVADITTTEPAVDNADWIVISNPPAYEEILQTLSGGTPTWTVSAGNAAKIQLSENCTITLTGEPAGAVMFMAFLEIKQDGSASGYTYAFSGATVLTEDDLGLPSLSGGANDIDHFILYTLDNGSNYVIRRVIRNAS